MKKVIFGQIDLPDFGLPSIEAKVPSEEYRQRITLSRRIMEERRLDALVIYGDREHGANINFLSGYDPRFEEALLIVLKESAPILMVGNEGWGYADAVVSIDLEKVLVQCFSLMGQPRDKMKELNQFFIEAGLKAGMKVGLVGWKYFTSSDFSNPRYAIEIPTYITKAIQDVVSPNGVIVNANDIFMHPEKGLRVVNSVEQIAVFEFAATVCSQAIHDMIESLQPGMTEFEAVQTMKLNGIPLSCHLMLSTGDRAFYGLPSPSMKIIEIGDPLTAALGLTGALTCRAGYVVKDEKELAGIQPDYLSDICAPYFSIISDWYETICIGTTGNEIQQLVDRQLRETSFNLAVNPGHLIHLDEWLHTPFYHNSTCKLKSGMAIQVDLIPSHPEGKFYTNIEDGIALGDVKFRDELKSKYPETCNRIERRRNFMSEVLGITIKPEVLPLSNNQAVLRPFLLNKNMALRIES